MIDILWAMQMKLNKKYKHMNKKTFRKWFLKKFNIRSKRDAEAVFFVEWIEICWRGYLKNDKYLYGECDHK